MDNGWTEIDGEIVRLVARKGEASPQEIACDLGISEGEATAFLCMLAREGRIRIRLVEVVPAHSLVRRPAAA